MPSETWYWVLTLAQAVRGAFLTGKSSPKYILRPAAVLDSALTNALQCYSKADAPSQCRAPADDYLECLHHTKEV